MSLTMRLFALLFLSMVHLPLSIASDVNDPFCNGRRVFGGAEKIATMNPDYSTNCYAYARKIIRKAFGHDYYLTEAEGVLETLLTLNPESAQARIGSAELEMKKRELNLNAKSLYEIYKEASSATRIEPPVADAFITLGRVNLLLGCLICAESAAESASVLDASNPELALLLSFIEDERNNVAGAKEVLIRALASQSTQITPEIKIEILLRISLLYAIEKNYAAADKGYDKAIDLDPGNPVPYLARARLLLLTGDADAAKQAAKKSSRVKATVIAKRLQSFAEYLSWAAAYLEGDRSEDIKKIIQRTFVSPEEAFVESAQYETTSIVTEALLKAKVIRNIDTRDGQGNTALMVASLGNNIKLVNILMEHNANLNSQNGKGERALTYLVSNGNYDETQTMLDSNVEVNYLDVNGNSPLSLAVFRKDKLLVRELLAHNASMQPVIKLAKRLGIEGIEEIIESMIPASI